MPVFTIFDTLSSESIATDEMKELITKFSEKLEKLDIEFDEDTLSVTPLTATNFKVRVVKAFDVYTLTPMLDRLQEMGFIVYTLG